MVAVKAREREHLFELSPSFQKWIHTCDSCGLQGYKPEMRAEYFFAGVGARDIKKLFDELPLNDLGLCSKCSEVFGKFSR